MIYLAQPMSGRLWEHLVKEAEEAVATLKDFGFDVWSPVLSERKKRRGKYVGITSRKQLRKYWDRDLEGMKSCDAMLSLRGDMSSEGVGFEIAVAAFVMQIPTVVVAPVGSTTRISHLYAKCVPDLMEAARVLRRWMK